MISLILPSRGRPGQLLEMWHTAIETAVDPDSLEMVVRIDEDDDSYDELRSRGARKQIHWVVGERVKMSALWNDSYAAARGDDIFMHCADDIRFRTPAWDLHVETAFNRIDDRIGFVYGRDGGHDQNLGTHGFLSRQWIDTVGYFLPPYFSCDYADTWLNEVSEKIGRRVYVPEILTEHMHPSWGKGPIDQTHVDRFERDLADNNTALWHELAPVREEWVAKLRAVIT